jgi:hypothetical protein
MGLAKTAVFFKFQLIRGLPFIFGCGIIFSLTGTAG